MSVAEVRARWHTFIEKIAARHTEVIREAEVGCLQLLDLARLDTNPMANAWSGVRSQLLALHSKIDETWSEKVEEAFRAAYENDGNDGDYFDEFEVGRRAMLGLEQAAIRAETQIFASAADRLMEAAKQELSAQFNCTQCGATLDVDRQVFRSQHVKCAFCGVLNTYNPGSRVRTVESFCAHYLAKRATWELEEKMNLTWEQVRAARAASHARLLELEAAVKAYWSAYYAERARVVPDLGKDRSADLAARLTEFYAAMKHEKNWPKS